MNTRQLNQGLLPTIEFEKSHTYKTFRHFPELRMSMREIDTMKTKRSSNLDRSKPTVSIARSLQQRSTHRLDELSKSSLDEMSSTMSDFRRILLDNRKKNQVLLPGERPRAMLEDAGSIAPSSSSATLQNSEEEFQGDPLSVANQKLTKVSVSFDAMSYNSHLAGFTGAKLSKQEFETQLRRCVNVNLKRVELDALFNTMDDDGSGLIDGVEFVRYFFQLGNEARWKMLMDTKHLNQKRAEFQKKLRENERLRVREWQAEQIAEFTQEDYESAMKKLADAAFRFDGQSYVDSATVGGFEAFLTPFEFKMQVERSFNVKMTGAEIGSLISSFSTRDDEYCVDGYLFFKKFRTLQSLGWENHEKVQVINRMAKNRVLQMGQNTDILPKLLGR